MTVKECVQVIVLLALGAAGLLFVWKSRKIRAKRPAAAIVLLIALAASFGVGKLPLESLAGPFPSFEAAFAFSNPHVLLDKIAVVEGQESTMTFIPDPRLSQGKVDLFYKTEKGWKAGSGEEGKALWEASTKDGAAALRLYRCRETGELFLRIDSNSREPLEITDSLGTAFINLDTHYFACIGQAQGYSLRINGTAVDIPGPFADQ